MGITKNLENDVVSSSEEEELGLTEECKQMLFSLPKERGWRTSHLYKYQSFWCQPAEIQAVSAFQNHFQARDNDVVLCTIPKSGTTWLKALAFAVLNRDKFPVLSSNHPLLSSNPHDLVPFFEYKLYANGAVPAFPDPAGRARVFGTHVPYRSLANSIKKSNCRIVYLCRNPLDTFVSSWHFIGAMTPFSMEEAFGKFCDGVVGFGPFWEHMLGYWKESLENPEKVLFLTYEDVKDETVSQVKKLARFLECPFSAEEERSGVVESVMKLCSFENLKELEINKNGKSIKNFENKKLFRKGEVGDWVNHLSPKMVEKMKRVVEEKMSGSRLKFKVLSD